MVHASSARGGGIVTDTTDGIMTMLTINVARSDNMLNCERSGTVFNITSDELRYRPIVRDVVWMDDQRNPDRSWFITPFTVPFRSVGNIGPIDIPNALISAAVHVLPRDKDWVLP